MFISIALIFLSSCFAIASSNPDGVHHVPYEAQDQGPQLPTVGASYFDKIFSQVNASGQSEYRVPFPLKRLLEELEPYQPQMVHSMFPFSRSLQRPVDLSYDPIENPRLVLSPHGDATLIGTGKLFIGYVKAKDQLEVISYNDEAGRFEYQIVTKYSTPQPEVFYVDRGKCLSCHQGQAAIFSPPNWSDSTFGPMKNLIFARLRLSEGSEATKRKLALTQLFGEISSQENIALLDHTTRVSQDVALDERIWVHGCGIDSKCRLGLLVKTLASTAAGADEVIRYAQHVLNTSKLRSEQLTFSSFLTSSDIGLRAVFSKFGSYQAIVDSSEALLQLIGHLYNLSPQDNPATPRPVRLAERDLLKPLATFSRYDRDVLLEAWPSVQDLFARLQALHEAKHEIFDPNAIDRWEIMSVLLEASRAKDASHYSQWRQKPTPTPKFFNGGFIPVFKTPELNLMARHCQKCHATDLKFPPQFLVGTEQEVFSQLQILKPKMLFKLENQLMPPNKTQRDQFIRSGDYDRVVEFIRSLD